MSNRQTLAEHGTALVVSALALAGAVGQGGTALVSLSVLVAWGLDIRNRCPKRQIKQATKAAFKALESYQDLTKDNLIEAVQYLEDTDSQRMLDPRRLGIASGSVPELMMAAIDPEETLSSGARSALDIVFKNVYQVLRLQDDFHKVLTQEQLKQLIDSGVQIRQAVLDQLVPAVQRMGAGVDQLVHESTREATQQPRLEPPDKSESFSHFAQRTLDVLGRDAEQQQLCEFLNAGSGFRWLQLAGEAGQGKSRLALELVDEAKGLDWAAGWLKQGNITDFADRWRDWVPGRSYLLVIDYIVGTEELVGTVMHALARRDSFDVTVCLLLLERQRWDQGGVRPNTSSSILGDNINLSLAMGSGRAEWFLKLAEHHTGDDQALKDARFGDGVIELTELDSRTLVSIVRDVAKQDGQTISLGNTAIAEQLQRIDEAGRPLYAYFLGKALSGTQDNTGWTRAELLDAVLGREYRTRWKKQIDGTLPALGDNTPAQRLAVLATMIGHVDCEQLANDVDWGTVISPTRREALVLTGGPIAEGVNGPGLLISGLAPDLLGEWFVLTAFCNGMPVEELVNAAWRVSPSAMSAFIVRVVQDFPGHVHCERLLQQDPPTEEGKRAYALASSVIVYALVKSGRQIPGQTIQALTRAADAGDGSAMTNLGVCNLRGYGVKQDQILAVKWFRKGAAAGDFCAMDNLGVCYHRGIGVEAAPLLAVKWFHKGADVGYGPSMSNLGACYQRGIGVNVNLAEAVKWYSKGAAAGYGGAMFNLGACYQRGIGVNVKLAKAAEWYSKGAAAGHGSAMFGLGACYQRGIGVNVNLAKAVTWFCKGADTGHGGAMFNLGACYQLGIGVGEDVDKAVEWYRKGVEARDGDAMAALGGCYREGIGVGEDVDKAVKWYRKGADAGNGGAMYNLGVCYQQGYGVGVNLSLAAHWRQKAIEAGYKFD
ncbi:MAG: SEL1-like repeat protein [Granulosicoccus sp.]